MALSDDVIIEPPNILQNRHLFRTPQHLLKRLKTIGAPLMPHLLLRHHTPPSLSANSRHLANSIDPNAQLSIFPDPARCNPRPPVPCILQRDSVPIKNERHLAVETSAWSPLPDVIQASFKKPWVSLVGSTPILLKPMQVPIRLKMRYDSSCRIPGPPGSSSRSRLTICRPWNTRRPLVNKSCQSR